jgi:hypothetical protein
VLDPPRRETATVTSVGASNRSRTLSSFAFESFGVRFRVAGDAPEVIARLPELLPPDARPCGSAEDEFAVLTEDSGRYRFTRGGPPVTSELELDEALGMLEAQVQIHVGLHARNRIFVHAGVVAHDGRAIVIPGRSFVGKSTLVLALVRAGAVYYSDEFAVIDERGLVHPYALPLRSRGSTLRLDDHERLEGRQDGEPLPIGAVLVTSYRAGTVWKPTRLPPGRGVLAMLANTLTALARPQEATRFITRGLEGAVVLEGQRGEADDVARVLPTVLADAEARPGVL